MALVLTLAGIGMSAYGFYLIVHDASQLVQKFTLA